MEILILCEGDPRYEEVIGGLRDDQDLLDLMWQAAESRLDEHPDKVWIVAVDGARALAWCAYQPATDPRAQVQAVNSFERPEAWDADWYGVVYAVRHELIRYRAGLTYVYDEIVDLHGWDGWTPTDDGWSNEPDTPSHHWTELLRPADPTPSIRLQLVGGRP
ncbi:hypothetical protein [Polymorphospora sp. NPDC050346]|uniref:hypothetical protein n=1 Tax=Polymorphospora sp. NPDC050346 TaxID=3155780 RepID=UPI0033E9FEC0